ncbi:MAG: hypothetical protein LT071_10920, partial [Nocardioides sp.]|nr:hypothetical protein [Nocardioides sp.]
GTRRPGEGVYDTDVDVRQLGWVDDDHVAALVTPQGDTTYDSTPQLVVMTSGDVRDDEASWRIAARWDVGPGSIAGVAVDLLGLGEGVPGVTGVRDLPAPRWPWSDEQKAVVAVLALLAAVAGGFAVRQWRRRRRPI